MGSITTGVGLVSGIDTASLIENLIALESGGRISLQNQVANLQSQQTALLDINARLLNLFNAAKGFREDSLFRTSVATTTDETIATATASTKSQPGSYKFIVKQLVSASSKLSQGFATDTATPLGLETLSIELGNGTARRDNDLADLNGGAGVDRGRILISDRSSDDTVEIDLTDVITLNEAMARINDAEDVDVTATIQGDHLVITDNTGLTASNLTITSAPGDTTAADLGIEADVAADSITGTSISFIGGDTALATLNDGAGVLIRDFNDDIEITARDGTTFGVDFGRVDVDIDEDTLLSDLNNGSGVTISSDEDNNDIKFVDRLGAEHEVDLTGVTTIGQLQFQVSDQTGGAITISFGEGDRLTVNDNTLGTGTLQVLGAGDNGTATAEDLGILNVTGTTDPSFDGELIPNTITDPPALTIQNVIDRINTDEDNDDGSGNLLVRARIGGDGVSLEIVDLTGSTASNLIVSSTASNPHAAADLGIEASFNGNTIEGSRLIAGLNSVLLSSLDGGSDLSGPTSLIMLDRDSNLVIVNGLEDASSLDEAIETINAASAGAGANITLSLNEAGNRISVTDTSTGSGNLIIIDTNFDDDILGIETGAGGVAENEILGNNLNVRYVSHATKLEDLNYGRGVGTGTIRITDGRGQTAEVTIGSDAETVYDVIEEINAFSPQYGDPATDTIRARINDAGDGIIIESLLDPGEAVVALQVESVSGSTASDLNILGQSETLDNAFIDGSYEASIDVATTDTLDDIVDKINDAGIPVSASIINTGSGATPYHLSLTSGLTGRIGELVIDSGGVDLGFTTLSEGRDAKVFFGADAAEDGFLLTSATNSLSGVVEGVTVDLVATSDEAVTINVARDETAITGGVSSFVAAINDVIGVIDQYDFFNLDTEQRGPLLGSSITSRISQSIYSTLQQRAEGVGSAYQFLTDVGFGVNGEGDVTFDQDEFAAAYAEDPDAVENLFAAFESSGSSFEEIAPGVTIFNSTEDVTTRGFGDLFADLADGLTNSVDGSLKAATDGLDARIELLNDRIELFDERLETKRARLQAEFAAMELALSNLTGQSSALLALQQNVALAGA